MTDCPTVLVVLGVSSSLQYLCEVLTKKSLFEEIKSLVRPSEVVANVQ